MEDDTKERKRKKKIKKHSHKTKKRKRAKQERNSDEDVSSDGELQWVESTSLEDSTKKQPASVTKREDWMTMHLGPSSGSLAELTHRRKLEEEKEVVTEVHCMYIHDLYDVRIHVRKFLYRAHMG